MIEMDDEEEGVEGEVDDEGEEESGVTVRERMRGDGNATPKPSSRRVDGGGIRVRKSAAFTDDHDEEEER